MRRRGTIAVSWGRYGGLYLHRHRVCLGRLAITYSPVEIDDLMEAYASRPSSCVECPSCGDEVDTRTARAL